MTTGKIGSGPHVRIYFQPKSASGKEEGIVRYCRPRGNRFIVDQSPGSEEHFDYLDEIPEKIRTILRRKNVQWPP
jgi:hypothetical protein